MCMYSYCLTLFQEPCIVLFRHTSKETVKQSDRWGLTVHFACHARWTLPSKTAGKARGRVGERKNGMREWRKIIERDSYRTLLRMKDLLF